MEKSQNIAATVRKHHEWISKLGVSAFNGQSTERSKAILTKCAPVECRKKYPPHGLSRANTAPHHAAAFWEKHGWISKLGVSIPRAKQWKKARPSSGNSGRGIISQGLFASWPRSTYHADLPVSRRWRRDREWASYAWQEDVAPFRTGDQMQIVFLGFTDKHHRPGSLRADKHSRILPLKSECPSSWNYH